MSSEKKNAALAETLRTKLPDLTCHNFCVESTLADTKINQQTVFICVDDVMMDDFDLYLHTKISVSQTVILRIDKILVSGTP